MDRQMGDKILDGKINDRIDGKWVNTLTGGWSTGEEDRDINERRMAGWVGSGCVHTHMHGRPDRQEDKEMGRYVEGCWWEDQCEKGRNRQDEKTNGKIYG